MRAGSALPLALPLGVASPAAALSLFGEVIAEDPTALLPGERFGISVRAGVEAREELDRFEGTLRLFGAELDGAPSLRVGVPGQTAFVSVSENQVVASMVSDTPPIGIVPLMDLSLVDRDPWRSLPEVGPFPLAAQAK